MLMLTTTLNKRTLLHSEREAYKLIGILKTETSFVTTLLCSFLSAGIKYQRKRPL